MKQFGPEAPDGQTHVVLVVPHWIEQFAPFKQLEAHSNCCSYKFQPQFTQINSLYKNYYAYSDSKMH